MPNICAGENFMVLLKGERVYLRPLETDDMKDFFHWINNPEAVGEFDTFGITEWSEVEKIFKEPKGANEFTILIIEKNKEKSKVGLAVHYLSHPIMRNIEIGFQIWDPKERNKGYATEAVKLLVEYLFLTKNIQRVQATTHVLNKPAQHVLEKCGFVKEGQLREALFTNGEFHDVYIYGLTRKEWRR
jgi:RimJ/RimL family protein N-acetyltransferase